MIGYQAYAAPQAAFVNRYTDPTLTLFTKDVASLYVPEIQQVETSACCSGKSLLLHFFLFFLLSFLLVSHPHHSLDHQSFYERGYPSVGLVEGGGYTIDPKYHNVGDTVNRTGYSLLQMQGVTRILIAAGAHIAELN